ncbi:MAG: c-type cytochrome [Actinomycetota bacterium]
MKRVKIAAILFIIVLAITAIILASRFSLAAVEEPGRAETYLATKGKHFLIARESRVGIPREPADSPESVAEGDKLYGAECAMCHGMSAHTPTDAGRWMYPRAADLTSSAVQGYSNRELFWIIKNGIRLSGMPAFGRVESDDHIWSLVHYLRSLRQTRMKTSGTETRTFRSCERTGTRPMSELATRD